MARRDEIITKVVKMLRLARAAGTEAEAQTALLLAQKLMYSHDIAEGDLAEPDSAQPLEDQVIDAEGHRVAWKEYLAAIIAESFRCAFIISESKSSRAVRLVFVGRRHDVLVATEAYVASAAVAASLSEECASTRAPSESDQARASFLTGFLKGLLDRLTQNASSASLLVIADPVVLEHAASFTNREAATGGALPTSDARALNEGLEAGHLHGSGTRLVRG